MIKRGACTIDTPPSDDEPDGYEFTVLYQGGEAVVTKCEIFGDEEHFDNSVYRELMFYHPDDKIGWRIHTSDGKLVAAGIDEYDIYKFLCAKTVGKLDAYEPTPIIETLTGIGDEVLYIGEDAVSFYNGEFFSAFSYKYRASVYADRQEWIVCETLEGAEPAKFFNTEDEFWAEMVKRDACTIDVPPKPPADITEQCDLINEAAPDGWSIESELTYKIGKHDSPGVKYLVRHDGELVTTLDTLSLANFLSIDEFFEQFKPLVGNVFDADRQFIADRKAEIAALKEMLSSTQKKKDRAKIKALIKQNQRALRRAKQPK